MRRNAEGFPIYFLATVIKQSNNLANMTLMALAELSGDVGLQRCVMGLYRDYGDCLQLSPM
ncbi:hypothetical protein [Deefgea sp. CFH1-16]|uniref:DUF6988 family protein n=1 Tax=Deefgea sp. CFH1-16 TaxID=2675457 RepID=UPI0035B26E8A